MRCNTCRVVLFAGLMSCLLFAGACAQDPAARPQPGQFTLADFRGLRFLEGDWQGSGYAPGPFFETYRFVNDSTIEMMGWADSTLTRREGDPSQYVFRGGVIRKGDGRAALVHIDSLGYHFHTMSGQPHQWVFRRVSADRWTATLGRDGRTVYTMDRMRR